MKNRIFCFIICSCVAWGLTAQNHTDVRFGLRAGLNLSYMDFSRGSPPPEVPVNNDWEPGLVAGFVVIVPLKKNFFFQPEYLFSQTAGEISDLNTLYRFNYFTLPVLIRWEYKNFSVAAGPQFGLLINSKKKIGDSLSSSTNQVEERNIAVTGGIGYSFLNSFGLEIRYVTGLNHVGLEIESEVKEFKYEMVQISLFYFL